MTARDEAHTAKSLAAHPMGQYKGFNPDFYRKAQVKHENDRRRKFIEAQERIKQDNAEAIRKMEKARLEKAIELSKQTHEKENEEMPLPPADHPVEPETIFTVDAWRNPTVEEIKARVALLSGVSIQDMEGIGRQKSIMIPRHMAQYLARKYTDRSLNEIAARFNGRDHATIKHAVDNWGKQKEKVRAER